MGKREDNEAFERACAALRGGEIGEGEFLRRTRAKWAGTARHLFKRWGRKLPAWVEPCDVEQELRLLALRAVRKWEPGRSAGTIGQFVLWGAIHRGQRYLDACRGASTHGSSGKNPSRCEKAFSRAFPAFRDEQERDPLDRLAPVAPTQEDAVEAEEDFREVLGDCETVREALVLMALRRAEGSVREAAAILYEDFAARVECSLRSEEDARRAVGESVARIATRMGYEGDALAPPEDLFADEDETTNGASAERAA